MVKSKRDLKSPRRRASLTKLRPIVRPRSTQTVSTSSVANVKVIVRVRPPNEREQQGDTCRLVVKVINDQMLVFDPKEDVQPFFYHGVQQRTRDLLRKSNKHLQFLFDRVFDNQTTNENVFKDTTYSLIGALMDGFNCSVFAYGATGAGKTFTMIGNQENPGITFLTMAELFRKRDELSVEREFDVGITYLEVYNELVQDLLNPGPALNLREDSKYGVVVAGIKMHKIANCEELFSLLEQGNRNRTQHPTDANAESSRSHAVFQVYIQMRMKTTREVRSAKLSMIDLAGSERGSATGCVGARFTEGANINKSLLALGNCINSLADGQRHVPYRDSKLTRLLKDSLGGNCQTVMIANVSPSSLSYEDTYNTLKYANRAKKIKSNVKRNVATVELHMEQYVKMIDELKREVTSLKRQLHEEKNKSALETERLKKALTDLRIPDAASVSPSAVEELESLFEERRTLLERQCHVELSEKETRQLQEGVDGGVKCFHALEDEIDLVNSTVVQFDKKIDDLLCKYPELNSMATLESQKLLYTEINSKLKLKQKEAEILRDEDIRKSLLLGKMSGMLQTCFNLARNHGLVTDVLINNYNELVKDCDGIISNKGVDNIADSGLSSTSSLDTLLVTNKEKKRKNEVPLSKNISNLPLENTFVLPRQTKPKVKLCAENFMAKVYKPAPSKRVKIVNSVSSRDKELLRKPLTTIPSIGRTNMGPSKGVPAKSPKRPFRK